MENIKEGLDRWLSGADMSRFGSGTVLVHDLFVDYSGFCCRSGFTAASARGMSDYMESRGYTKKRVCRGMAFIVR